MNELLRRILEESSANWFRNPAGLSASDIADKLGVPHEEICKAVEILSDAGHGTINRDVELGQLSMDLDNPSAGFIFTPIKTHIFFPSKQVLADAFYKSDLPQKKLPEYEVRLHLGAHQLGLVYFSEEVLVRYFDHPELYVIDDSLAGGNIRALEGASEERYLYVRYGKCRLKSGHVSVTAIFKDLARMGNAEQRYWHAYEISAPLLDTSDSNFQTFLSRTYDGAYVEYPNPIGKLLGEMAAINASLAPKKLFPHSDNIHLRMPVEQTYKSYCDCASELYKIIGPDALSQSTLKALLQKKFQLSEIDFLHSESKRPFSSLQLLELLELKLLQKNALVSSLKKVAKLRVDADHKVLEPDKAIKNYSIEFGKLCEEVTNSIGNLRKALLGTLDKA